MNPARLMLLGLGRRWLGIELNPAYVAMQGQRAAQLGMELHA